MKNLVKKAQRGDKEAFVSLMELNKQAMYKAAVGILKNDSDAADAMQDTTLTCYEKLGSLKNPDLFKTWMTRILINHCMRILKEHKKMVSIQEYQENTMSREEPQTVQTENQEFFRLLNQMEEQYRVILTLYYVEEFSVREIGMILEMKENTVKTRLSRGRRLFQKLYLKEYPTEQYRLREV